MQKRSSEFLLLAYTKIGVSLGFRYLCGKILPLRLQATVVEIITIVILSVILEIRQCR